MNIIIVGAGKVGFNLAKTLSIRHNVIIIDKNDKALQRIKESIDILALKGDVEDLKTYINLPYTNVDLFIAVTNIDNVNLISSLIIDNVFNVGRKFIRLQKHFYDDKIIKERLNIQK